MHRARRTGPSTQAGCPEPPAVVVADVGPPALAAVRRRWAEPLRRIFAVEPLRCPRCGDAMRIVGFITQAPVIDRILTDLRRPAPPTRRPRGRPPLWRPTPAARRGSTRSADAGDGAFSPPHFRRAD